jgi:hypothetical protein
MSMIAVPVTTKGDAVNVGTPRALFAMTTPSAAGNPQTYQAGGNSGPGFDVLPDGRFVMVRSTTVPVREIVVVRNFAEEARRLAPAP